MLFKYSLVALLSFSSVTVYASAYSGFYCKIDGYSVSGWNSECKGEIQGCDTDGYECKYCMDCTSAERVCKAEGGQLWRASIWESWSNGDGEEFSCSEGESTAKLTTDDLATTGGTPGTAGTPGAPGTAGTTGSGSFRAVDGLRGADGVSGADGSSGI
ncbi:hypothetical protein EDC94DRAFT_629214 [Helicostylum pulchrum]|nr:hypothetical protein EDC94DRAFT_629214 [Helicostylum pulchrum]